MNHDKQGNVDQKLAMREKIEMDDILKEDTRFVIIEGAAGMGKSTLAWEICRSWDKLESLKRFSLVIFVRLQEEEVQLAKHVSDLFYHSDRELSANVGREVEKRDGECVLFVFDGFDEFPAEFRKKSLMMKIIGDPRYFRKAAAIVTSRPSALGDLQRFIDDEHSRHIEITGLTKTEILEYAFQRLALHPEAHPKDFFSYLSLNPAVEGMMYNPLHAAIVLEIYLDPAMLGRPAIYTQTQLYGELTLWLISRYVNETERHQLPNRLEELCTETDIYSQLIEIGQLAFEGTCNEQVIFKNLTNNFDGLGLLIKRQSLRESSEFLFVHSTLQEFLSAYFISKLKFKEQRDIFQKYSSMRSVWVYVAGMTKMASIGWREFTRGSISNISKADTFTVQCIYEAQDLHSCNIDSGNGIEFLELNPTNYDLFALGYSILACGNTWKIAIQGDLREDGFEMFGHGILSAESHSGGALPLTIEVKTVCTSCGVHTEQLLRMPPEILRSIKALYLFDCFHNMEEKKILYLSSGFRSCIESVTSFIVKNGQEETTLDFFEPLTVPMNKMLEQYVDRFEKNVAQSFKIGVAKLPKEHCILVEQLISLPSLQSLVIQESIGAGFCGLELFESISDSITFLVFADVFQDQYKYYNTMIPSRPQGVSGLTNMLRRKSSLEIFKLNTVMTRDEVRDIVESVKENKNLELLELSRMYSFCFPWIEWKHIDYRVQFVRSPVHFNHTQKSGFIEILLQTIEEGPSKKKKERSQYN